MDDVAIIGVGQSVFARKCGVSVKELCFDAYKEAIEGIDLTNKDIDASITCSAPGARTTSPWPWNGAREKKPSPGQTRYCHNIQTGQP